MFSYQINSAPNHMAVTTKRTIFFVTHAQIAALLRIVVYGVLFVTTATAFASNQCYMLVASSTPTKNPDLPAYLADVSRKPTIEKIPEIEKKIMRVSKQERDGVRSALGYVYCRTGQYQQTLDSLKNLVNSKSRAFNPHLISALNNTAVAHFELGNTQRTLELIGRIHKTGGFGKYQAMGNVGDLAFKLGKSQLARNLLEESITGYENQKREPSSFATNALAAVYQAEKDSEALDALVQKYGNQIKPELQTISLE